MDTNLAKEWANLFTSRRTQQKGQEKNIKVVHLTLKIKDMTFHGTESLHWKIESMQTLASPSILILIWTEGDKTYLLLLDGLWFIY